MCQTPLQAVKNSHKYFLRMWAVIHLAHPSVDTLHGQWSLPSLYCPLPFTLGNSCPD